MRIIADPYDRYPEVKDGQLMTRVFRFSQIAEISSFRRKPDSGVSCCKEVLGSRFRGNDGVRFSKTERP